MDNASLFYDQIKCCEDIQDLVNQRTIEEIFLDFKEKENIDGKMGDHDKSAFSKAASGFAHQEGGVLVWGIEARKEDPKDQDSLDCAINLKPINKLRSFHQELTKYISMATEPPVDGILHKMIFENNDQNSDRGFVISLFPKSHLVHRTLGPRETKHRFYKRHGCDFYPLNSTAEIRELFFRSLSPELELNIFRQESTGLIVKNGVPGGSFALGFALENRGTGIAKNCSVNVWLQGEEQFSWDALGWYDPEGCHSFKTAQLLANYDRVRGRTRFSTKYIKLNPGIVICPEEEMAIAMVACKSAKGTNPKVIVKYKIFAENMIPKEGTTELIIEFENAT